MEEPCEGVWPYWAWLLVLRPTGFNVILNHSLRLEQLGMALFALSTNGELICRLFKWLDM